MIQSMSRRHKLFSRCVSSCYTISCRTPRRVPLLHPRYSHLNHEAWTNTSVMPGRATFAGSGRAARPPVDAGRSTTTTAAAACERTFLATTRRRRGPVRNAATDWCSRVGSRQHRRPERSVPGLPADDGADRREREAHVQLHRVAREGEDQRVRAVQVCVIFPSRSGPCIVRLWQEHKCWSSF